MPDNYLHFINIKEGTLIRESITGLVRWLTIIPNEDTKHIVKGLES